MYDINKIQESFKSLTTKVDNIKFRDKSYFYSLSTSRLLELITDEVSSLQDLIKAINSFISIEYSEEEIALVSYIDDAGIYSSSQIDYINSVIIKLRTQSAALRKQSRTKKKEPEPDVLQDLYQEIFNYELQLKSSRIRDFLNGELNPDLAWQDAITIRLDSGSHLYSLDSLNGGLNRMSRILRAFARANTNNESDFQIYEIKNGSLLVTVLAISGIVITLGKAVNQILDAIKKSYEIKQHIIGLKKIKSDSLKDAIKQLETEVVLDDKISQSIADQLILDIGYKGQDKNEVRTYLKKAIDYLFDFYDKGGELSLLLRPKSLEDEPEQQMIKHTEIKLIELREERKKLLEASNQQDWKILKMKFD